MMVICMQLQSHSLKCSSCSTHCGLFLSSQGFDTLSPMSRIGFVVVSTCLRSSFASGRMSCFFVSTLSDVMLRVMLVKSEYFIFRLSVSPLNPLFSSLVSSYITVWYSSIIIADLLCISSRKVCSQPTDFLILTFSTGRSSMPRAKL